MHKLSLVVLLLVAMSPAWADDSVEAAATGNLVFEKTPELIMQDETLQIQKLKESNLGDNHFTIDVDFHFKNISNHDITRKIAFVLPPVQCRMEANSMWGGLDLEKADTDNKGLQDFVTTVNDKPQVYTTRNEAILANKNITKELNQLGIPLNPCRIQLTAEGKPDPQYADKLTQYHLLTQNNDAAWSEHIYFEWTQTFPAGKVIHIHHRYTPLIGESVLSPRSLQELNQLLPKNEKLLWSRNISTIEKLNPKLIITRKEQNNQFAYCVMPQWVRYHLSTGANWRGGIGTFKLIVNNDNDTPFAINQFYQARDKAITMVNSHSMSFTIKNFIPTKNLLALFLSIPTTPDELKFCSP